LTLFRDHIVEEPKIPFVNTEIVLPDPVLEDIVNNVKYIVTLQQLHRTVEKHYFHVRCKGYALTTRLFRYRLGDHEIDS